jgi:hypothetical protein
VTFQNGLILVVYHSRSGMQECTLQNWRSRIRIVPRRVDEDAEDDPIIILWWEIFTRSSWSW